MTKFIIPKLPNHVLNAERAVLYKKMVLGKKFHFEGEFLDKRHDALYATLSDLQGYSPCLGTHELLLNLKDRGELEAAGGACYVQTIFEGLEPTDEEECL